MDAKTIYLKDLLKLHKEDPSVISMEDIKLLLDKDLLWSGLTRIELAGEQVNFVPIKVKEEKKHFETALSYWYNLPVNDFKALNDFFFFSFFSRELSIKQLLKVVNVYGKLDEIDFSHLFSLIRVKFVNKLEANSKALAELIKELENLPEEDDLRKEILVKYFKNSVFSRYNYKQYSNIDIFEYVSIFFHRNSNLKKKYPNIKSLVKKKQSFVDERQCLFNLILVLNKYDKIELFKKDIQQITHYNDSYRMLFIYFFDRVNEYQLSIKNNTIIYHLLKSQYKEHPTIQFETFKTEYLFKNYMKFPMDYIFDSIKYDMKESFNSKEGFINSVYFIKTLNILYKNYNVNNIDNKFKNHFLTYFTADRLEKELNISFSSFNNTLAKLIEQDIIGLIIEEEKDINTIRNINNNVLLYQQLFGEKVNLCLTPENLNNASLNNLTNNINLTFKKNNVSPNLFKRRIF